MLLLAMHILECGAATAVGGANDGVIITTLSDDAASSKDI